MCPYFFGLKYVFFYVEDCKNDLTSIWTPEYFSLFAFLLLAWMGIQ